MQFLWSDMLALLLLIPLFIVAYVWAQRRRARFALRYPSLQVVQGAVDKRAALRRHVPPVVFLLAVAAMLLAFARPYTEVLIPKHEATIILTLDTSASMGASDIKPTRMQAAKAAARAFVEHQDPMPRIGIVAFSDSAYLVQAPTTNKQAVLAAIDRLTLDTTTAIGRGILTSLDAVFESNKVPALGVSGPALAPPLNDPTSPEKEQRPAGVVVLLTDGQNVVGPPPLEAAQEAASKGVRVFTIGIGTDAPSAAPGTRGAASTFPDELDEETLQKIAETTSAEYFRASDETALTTVYRNLDTQLVLTKEKIELSMAFTAAAIVLNLIGGVLAIVWLGRLP